MKTKDIIIYTYIISDAAFGPDIGYTIGTEKDPWNYKGNPTASLLDVKEESEWNIPWYRPSWHCMYKDYRFWSADEGEGLLLLLKLMELDLD